MNGHFLVLFPKNAAWAPTSLAILRDALKAIGLLGAERGSGRYSAGPEYLGLVSYLGCSPQIALGENDAATAIHLSGIFEAPLFLHGDNLKTPRCPQCRHVLASFEAEQELRCDRCGRTGDACAFDWRRSAAHARVFVEISNVFESEAVPGEPLIACLEAASGEPWDYCYVRKHGN